MRGAWLRGPPPLLLLLLLLLLVVVSSALPVARAAEFTAGSYSPPPQACAPQSSVAFVGETATRVEVICSADGTATTTFSALPRPTTTTAAPPVTRQLSEDTRKPSAAQQLIRTSDAEVVGSCTLGGDASCGDFQRCIAAARGGMERVCADYCAPQRCPQGLSCRLEPAMGCSSIGRTASCPPPVAVCFAPDSG